MSEPEVDPRFLLANERTLLAWIRTALSLQAAGVALIQLAPDARARWPVGLLLLASGALAALVGYRRWRSTDEALRSGGPMLPGRGLHVVALAVVALAVALVVGYLLSGPP